MMRLAKRFSLLKNAKIYAKRQKQIPDHSRTSQYVAYSCLWSLRNNVHSSISVLSDNLHIPISP